MSEPTGLALSLKLLFDDMKPREIADALNQALTDHQHWATLNSLGDINGYQLIYFSVADVLEELECSDEEYTGDAHYLNKVVCDWSLPDSVWDTLNDVRHDLIDALRNGGLIRALPHKVTP
jgi:hypothetical protein